MNAQLLKGFRDYGPQEMAARGRMTALIEGVFRDFGYGPLSTPALEYAAVLTGKYGEEGDKLLYRFADNGGRDVALRYDLTVPLARYLACNTEVPVPFRRYALAPVWRAERPQKGRFREFVQCDADLVGADTAAADAEILMLGAELMKRLGMQDYVIRLNHRGLLDALMEKVEVAPEKRGPVIRVLDKFHKVSRDELGREIEAAGVSLKKMHELSQFLDITGDNSAKLGQLASFCEGTVSGGPALDRLNAIAGLFSNVSEASRVVIDPTIARGLDYYTGVIYETFLQDSLSYGSVMSGGRYDKLLGQTGGRDLPAVGISLGLDRLFAALLDRGQLRLPRGMSGVLVAHFDETSVEGFSVASFLRRELPQGTGVEFYPAPARLKKQLAYADTCGVKVLVIPGPEEAAAGNLLVRNLESGEQVTVPLAARQALLAAVDGWLKNLPASA